MFTSGQPTRQWTVKASEPVGYEVRIADGLFEPDSTVLLEDARPGTGPVRRVVVTDTVVNDLYGKTIRDYFDHHGVEYEICVLPDGETAKTWDNVLTVVETLDRFGIDRRREPVIGIGGGVLLDIVGFVASTYRRGTPYIRVPTTLIGLVDAGVGVKTGFNFNGHKNRLGTYFAAERNLLDRTFLKTLGERHISNGLAEILKIALIKDYRLFTLLESYGADLVGTRMQGPYDGPHPDPALEAMERAIHGMLEELQPNLREKNLERVVDYGHTFSPTVEMQALPELLHGEAVAVDMALTTVLAERRGLVDASQRERIFRVMVDLNLPTWHELCVPDVLQPALADTVRHRNGQQRLPLPMGIGSAVFVNDVTPSELAEAAEHLAQAALAVAR
ncbi:sedoheptulose 7-phosphate cyclase [Streptomyces olivoreticuli]|uniref:sedoheptulose 7-phosphate cyclase n=1 Tax=Streptomyces olivoreticuli TaxID=68246 RepID=UPI000E25E7C1|nr:sedoheptulose 7-phosphate cyclase [Streptomyces olivoreticuli]